MMAPLFLLALWQAWLEIKIWKKGWFVRLLQSFWVLVFMLMLAVGLCLTCNLAQQPNTLMIFVPFLAIVAGRWILGSALGRFQQIKGLIVCLGIIFCVSSDGWIGKHFPTAERSDYYERFIGFLKGEERPYVPGFSYEVLAAGRPPIPDDLMVIALFQARKEIAGEMMKRRAEGFYSMVILGRGGGKEFWMQNGVYVEVGDDILKDLGQVNDFGNYPIQPISILIRSGRDEKEVIARLKENDLIKH